MKGYLFVGGPVDGKRIAVHGDVSVEIPILESVSNLADIDFKASINFSKIKYVKYNISKNYSVYIPVHFTHDQVMRKLVENYCPLFPDKD